MDEKIDPAETDSERSVVEVDVDISDEDRDGPSEKIVVEVKDGDSGEVDVIVDEEELETLPIVIEVNRKPVSMDVRRATGSEIKSAAIAQGVQIEMDFLLAVRRHGRTDPIKDKQEVRLHQGECFVANAADDNS